jgi:hypothetical protein
MRPQYFTYICLLLVSTQLYGTADSWVADIYLRGD